MDTSNSRSASTATDGSETDAPTMKSEAATQTQHWLKACHTISLSKLPAVHIPLRLCLPAPRLLRLPPVWLASWGQSLPPYLEGSVTGAAATPPKAAAAVPGAATDAPAAAVGAATPSASANPGIGCVAFRRWRLFSPTLDRPPSSPQLLPRSASTLRCCKRCWF